MKGDGPRLAEAAAAWGTPAFAAALAAALRREAATLLALAQRCSATGCVDPQGLEPTVVAWCEADGALHATIGLFYRELLGGCSCGEDPAEAAGYCEAVLHIDPVSGEVRWAGETPALSRS